MTWDYNYGVRTKDGSTIGRWSAWYPLLADDFRGFYDDQPDWDWPMHAFGPDWPLERLQGAWGSFVA